MLLAFQSQHFECHLFATEGSFKDGGRLSLSELALKEEIVVVDYPRSRVIKLEVSTHYRVVTYGFLDEFITRLAGGHADTGRGNNALSLVIMRSIGNV